MSKFTKEQKFKILKVALAAFVLFALSVISLIIPLRPEVSELEKRELAKFPEFTVEAFFDGSYFADISLWFSDTVPFRDTLVSLNSKVQNFLGTSTVLAGFSEGEKGDEIPDIPTSPPEENTTVSIPQETTTVQQETTTLPPAETTTSVSLPTTSETESTTALQTFSSIFVYENAGYEYYHFNQTASDNYAQTLTAASYALSGLADVYCMIVPTSIDITLADDIRQKLSVSDQAKAIEYMYSVMGTNVKKVNVYNTIKAHRDEYLYFRTDHHWTALGAYYAYTDFCVAKGISALPLSSFALKSFNGFLGSFYNDSGMNPVLSATPDTVDAYYPPCNTVMTVTDKNGETNVRPLIYDVSGNQASNKYSCFIFGDNPFTVIENTDLPQGESCLVIKESFGNCFVPFLAYHYKYVYVMDYRYSADTIKGLVQSYSINDVIFCNNISMTRDVSLVGVLNSHIE